MPLAFVMVNTDIGSENEVLEDLKNIDAVNEAYVVYGVYDVVAKVSADTMDKLEEIVTFPINHPTNFYRTQTRQGLYRTF